MQITISGTGVIAVVLWLAGAGLLAVASLAYWHPGWLGMVPMVLGNAAWMQGRMRREANRLACREDAAFDLGKVAAVRSIR